VRDFRAVALASVQKTHYLHVYEFHLREV